jgi:hypothetical protein
MSCRTGVHLLASRPISRHCYHGVGRETNHTKTERGSSRSAQYGASSESQRRPAALLMSIQSIRNPREAASKPEPRRLRHERTSQVTRDNDPSRVLWPCSHTPMTDPARATLPGALQRSGVLQRGQASGPNTLLRAHLSSDDLMWQPLCRCSAPCQRQRTERSNGGQDSLEQTARHHNLGHLEGDGPTVANDLRADLHQPVAQRGHGPVFYFDGQRQGAQEVSEVVAQCMQLKPHGIRLEAMAGWPSRGDSALAFLDVRSWSFRHRSAMWIIANCPDALIRPGAPI